MVLGARTATRTAPWDSADPEIHASPQASTCVSDSTVCATSGVSIRPGRLSVSSPSMMRSSCLRSYAALPRVTAEFIQTVRARVASWSTSDAGASTAPVVNAGSTRLGEANSLIVPPGTSVDVATAVRTSLSYGQRSGCRRMCDRLACRAYGFANSGYDSVAAHGDALLTAGYAHPADRRGRHRPRAARRAGRPRVAGRRATPPAVHVPSPTWPAGTPWSSTTWPALASFTSRGGC